MARNRKRAKDRRARRPQGASVSRRGVAGPGISDDEQESLENSSPEPLEHASPDVDIVEAQMALGRAEAAAAPCARAAGA